MAEPTDVLVLCALAEYSPPELEHYFESQFGLKAVRTNCHDCGREIIHSGLDLGIQAADLMEGKIPTDVDGALAQMKEVPAERFYVCGWCAADRAERFGDWELATHYRAMTRQAEGRNDEL